MIVEPEFLESNFTTPNLVQFHLNANPVGVYYNYTEACPTNGLGEYTIETRYLSIK